MRSRMLLRWCLGIALLAGVSLAVVHAQTRATTPAGRSQTLQAVHVQLQNLDTRIRNVWVKLGLAKPAPVAPTVPQPKTEQEATAQLDQIERRIERAEAEIKSQTKGASCSVDKFIDPVHNATWSCWPYRCQPGPPAHCPDACQKTADCVLGMACLNGGCRPFN